MTAEQLKELGYNDLAIKAILEIIEKKKKKA